MSIRSSITVKLIGYLLAVSVAPLLLFGMTSYELSRRAMVRLASESNARLLVDQRDYLLLQSEQVASLATNIAGVEDIGNALATAEANDSYSALVTQAKVGYILSGYSSLKGLASIDLFTPQGQHFHVGDTLDTSTVRTELRKRLYAATLASKQSIVWHGVEDNVNAASSHRKVLVATRLIRRVDPAHLEPEPVGIVVINYSTDHLYEHFRRLDLGAGSSLMVVDSQGRLLFHPDKGLIGQSVRPEFQALLGSASSTVAVKLGGQEVLLNHLRVQNLNWQVISVVPQATLMAPMARIGSAALAVLLACFATIGGVAVSYSRWVVAPIRAISGGFQNIQQDRLEHVQPLPMPRTQDEISEMVSWFNAFLDNLQARRRSEEELRQAKEAAESANRSKGEFLANMSHEIRTPMNAILGMTQLALDAESQAERRDFILKARRSAQSLLGIINDILDFSKIEAGKLELESVPLSLNEIISELADVFGSTAQDKGLELLFEVSPALQGGLLGDPLRLRQVLQNLISNALKFTAHGEVVVRVERVSEEGGKVVCLFSVRDTGIGISLEHQPHLFRSFFQTDSSVTRRYGGTGLGLAICKRLVEMMGGRIGMESEPGKGSCFWFQLPLTRLAADAVLGLDRVSPLPRGLRVLVVEDNASARQVLCAMCTSFGFQVRAVGSGQQALEALAADGGHPPYDLVLVDQHMPGLDGLETHRRIHSRQELAWLPVVLMTSMDERLAIARQTAAAGIRAYVNKPVTSSHLLEAIQHAIMPGKAEASASPREAEAAAPLRHLQSARILLVEDNRLNQEVALHFLRRAGLEVEVAAHGAEALERLMLGRYDAVLMDCQMPVMDGYEATRRIRAMPRFSKLPIIAMTANALEGDRERSLEAGMSDYLSKPIDANSLYQVLGRWLAQRSAGAEVVHPSEQERALSGTRLDPRHVNLQEALENLEGDVALYRKVAEMFLGDAPAYWDQFRSARGGGDPESATRAAHTLKSLAANIGAPMLRERARALELALIQKDEPAVTAASPAVEQEMIEVLAALKGFLGASVSS